MTESRHLKGAKARRLASAEKSDKTWHTYAQQWEQETRNNERKKKQKVGQEEKEVKTDMKQIRKRAIWKKNKNVCGRVYSMCKNEEIDR